MNTHYFLGFVANLVDIAGALAGKARGALTTAGRRGAVATGLACETTGTVGRCGAAAGTACDTTGTVGRCGAAAGTACDTTGAAAAAAAERCGAVVTGTACDNGGGVGGVWYWYDDKGGNGGWYGCGWY